MFAALRGGYLYNTHNDFSTGSSFGDPIINGIVCIEVVIIIVGMVVEGRNVASFFIPLAVIIVSHHCDPVQVFGEGGNVVTFVNHLFAR